MIKINLLPWRETQQKEKQQHFYRALSFGIIFTLCLLLVLHFYFYNFQSNQTKRNQVLQNEISATTQQLENIKNLDLIKKELFEKIETINQLGQQRLIVTHLFDEILLATPDDVFFTKISQAENNVMLEGYSRSNLLITQLILNLQASSWLANPTIEIIQTNQTENQFVLRLKQKNEN